MLVYSELPDDDVSRHWRAAAGKLLFDFDDGNGPVPAHRHLNPLGDLGGWVANSAEVHPSAYVHEGAHVTGKAQIGKQVLLQHGAKVTGEAKISGPVILGRHVHMGGTVECRYSTRIKHPIFIGYSPLLTGKRSAFENGRAYWQEADPLPELTCVKSHPIVNRWRQKGKICTMVMLDDCVIFTNIKRGYQPIDEYNDNEAFLTSMHGMGHKSWKDFQFTDAVVVASTNIRGMAPVLKSELGYWPKDDSVIERVGRIPTTVAHARLYMKH